MAVVLVLPLVGEDSADGVRLLDGERGPFLRRREAHLAVEDSRASAAS